MRRFIVLFVCTSLASCVGCRRPAPMKLDLPIDAPFPVDYPAFEGSIKSFAPKKIGEFEQTSLASGYDHGPRTLESWSAMYERPDGRQVQLRLRRAATAKEAYDSISSDRIASVGVPQGAASFERATAKGKTAGTFAKASYHNPVKNVDGEVVWCTRGNVAFVVSSSDGPHAVEFWRSLEAMLEY